MALNTGNKFVRRSWDVIPMPDTVITRVNALGSDQPEQFVFIDRRGRPIGDVEIQGVDPSDADHIEIPGVVYQTLTLKISRSQEWMWTFKIHKLFRLLIPKSTDRPSTYRTSNIAPGRCSSIAYVGHTAGGARATQVQ